MNPLDAIQARINSIEQLLTAFLASHQNCAAPVTPRETPVKQQTSKVITPTPIVEPPTTNYDWRTAEAARHSVRFIADEEGLTVQQKDNMSRTIHCESGYDIHCVVYNTDAGAVRKEKYNPATHGKIHSIDTGICQWNSYYHGTEITPHDAEFDPEKAVRLMCKYVKEGLISEWVCWSTKKALDYTP